MDLRVKRTINAIEWAAINLLLKQDLEHTTVQQIADKAQINKKTFYDHFSNKYQLADHLMDIFRIQYNKLLQARLENPQQLLDGVITHRMSGLLMTILDNDKLKKIMQVLTSIDEIKFTREMQDLMITNLKQYNVSEDELTVRVISAIALTTLEYYVETGEEFSLAKQESMVKTLESIIKPN